MELKTIFLMATVYYREKAGMELSQRERYTGKNSRGS
jgi:hypothetical protein